MGTLPGCTTVLRQLYIMLVPALAAYFKQKVVSSLFILACWAPLDQLHFTRQMTQHGLTATYVCNPKILETLKPQRFRLQGIIYFVQSDNSMLDMIKTDYYSNRFVWLVIGDVLPTGAIDRARYDADMCLFRTNWSLNKSYVYSPKSKTIQVEDIYIHPSQGASLHPLGFWNSSSGLVFTRQTERLKRRLDFKGYPLRIAAPAGYYSEDWYNGTYTQYLKDETLTEMDAGIRCGYGASLLLIQALNATEELVQTQLWGATVHNNSMVLMLKYGKSELGGGILRILLDRISNLDYLMPIWPFNVGFTYLAERESSSNMFVEPFTARVWCTCLGIGAVLAAAQRATARSREEKDDAFYAVLATWLQQDASAVPKGISGRWTFMVLSLCAMLVHAYYTSAIVSALMSTGRSGPDSLRTLADSRYSIASENYDYMRFLFFDVETNWEDLEYLKRKKKTSNFYQELPQGVQLIQEGSTAYHSEYNQIYPHFKTFTDDQICKLQHVDTIPETMTWVTSSPRGQFTNVLRAAGAWLHETGSAKRLTLRLLALRPVCRTALLAEKVNFGDVAPLLGLTALGAATSVLILMLEILIAKWKMETRLLSAGSVTTVATEVA